MGLTDAGGLVAGPLVVLLAGDAPLPHQLEGRLALKHQCIAMEKPDPSSFSVSRHSRVSTTPAFYLWNIDHTQLLCLS